MKKMGIFLSVLMMVIGLVVSAQAALVDMHDGTIYDTDTQLSWLQNANYAGVIKNWDQAVAWAASLNAGSGFAGLSGWRLPTSDTCSGYNCTNSEMGHLFYTELGNKGYCDAGGTCPQTGWGLTNTGPFTNLQADYYWSGTEYAPDTSRAWDFVFSYGSQSNPSKGNYFYAWAVRPGARSTGPVLIISGNNVGIGTDTPSQSLDVVGNINASGNIMAGSFTGNGSGLTGISGASIMAGTIGSGALTTGAVTDSNISGTISSSKISNMIMDAANTAVGMSALSQNTTGIDNTANGSGALFSNTTGFSNTATGNGALEANTAGNYNTAIGASALSDNTTGFGNTACGGLALESNTTGNDNTAVGASALRANTIGLSNTGTGMAALFSNTTGNYNTSNGNYALYSNTSGSGNTAIGANALEFNIDGGVNTAVGSFALQENTEGGENTAVGNDALPNSTSGWDNVAIGYHTLSSNYTGTANTAVGVHADVNGINFVNATAIGYGAKVDASYHVRIGNTEVTQIGGQVAWSNLSDIREKKGIQDISLGLDFIKSLRPVEFRMNQGNDRIDFGFIAQDIEALLGTEYNVLGIGGDEARTLSLRYTDFMAPMVKAMQEQQQIIEQQNDTIENLNGVVEKQNDVIGKIQKELDELKALVLSMSNR